MQYAEIHELSNKIISGEKGLKEVTSIELNTVIEGGEHAGDSLALILARTEQGLKKLLEPICFNGSSLFGLIKNKILVLKTAISIQGPDMFDTIIFHQDIISHIADDDNALLRYAKEKGPQEIFDKLLHIQLQEAMRFGNWKQVYILLTNEDASLFDNCLMYFMSCIQKYQFKNDLILDVAEIVVDKWDPNNELDDKGYTNLQRFILRAAENGYTELLEIAIRAHLVKFEEVFNTKEGFLEKLISDSVVKGDIELYMQLKQFYHSSYYKYLVIAAENEQVDMFKRILADFKFTHSTLDVLAKSVLIKPIENYHFQKSKASSNIKMLSIMVGNGYRLSKDNMQKLANHELLWCRCQKPLYKGGFFSGFSAKKKTLSDRDIFFNTFDIKTKMLMANNIGISYLDDGVNDFIHKVHYLNSLVEQVNNTLATGGWVFEHIDLCDIGYETLSDCIEILKEINSSSSLLTAALLLSRSINSEQLSFKDEPGVEAYFAKCMVAAIDCYRLAIEYQNIARPATYEQYELDKKVKDVALQLLALQHSEIKSMYEHDPEQYFDLMMHSNNVYAYYDARPTMMDSQNHSMFKKVYDTPKLGSIEKLKL